jgi:hypothetical protein
VKEEVLDKIKGLKYGAFIAVRWLDVVYSDNVPLKKLDNRHIVQYQRTPVFFIGIYKERRYSEPILVGARDDLSDAARIDIAAFPLGVIMKIESVAATAAHSKRLMEIIGSRGVTVRRGH